MILFYLKGLGIITPTLSTVIASPDKIGAKQSQRFLRFARNDNTYIDTHAFTGVVLLEQTSFVPMGIVIPAFTGGSCYIKEELIIKHISDFFAIVFGGRKIDIEGCHCEQSEAIS